MFFYVIDISGRFWGASRRQEPEIRKNPRRYQTFIAAHHIARAVNAADHGSHAFVIAALGDDAARATAKEVQHVFYCDA